MLRDSTTLVSANASMKSAGASTHGALPLTSTPTLTVMSPTRTCGPRDSLTPSLRKFGTRIQPRQCIVSTERAGQIPSPDHKLATPAAVPANGSAGAPRAQYCTRAPLAPRRPPPQPATDRARCTCPPTTTAARRALARRGRTPCYSRENGRPDHTAPRAERRRRARGGATTGEPRPSSPRPPPATPHPAPTPAARLRALRSRSGGRGPWST